MIRLIIFVSLFSLRAFSLQPLALVYAGPGACKEACAKSAAGVAKAAGFRVRYIFPDDFTAETFESAAVYIHPGGHSADAAVAISSDGKQALRDFISGGGGYVGFCAGAYFAAEHIRDEDSPDGYYKQDTLGLIPMTAAPYDPNSVALIVPVLWNGVARSLYWEGGPFIETPLAPSVEVVGSYGNGTVATVRTRYGAGRVFVTGTHPEAPQKWRDYYKLNDSDGLDVDLGVSMVRWAARR